MYTTPGCLYRQRDRACRRTIFRSFLPVQPDIFLVCLNKYLSNRQFPDATFHMELRRKTQCPDPAVRKTEAGMPDIAAFLPYSVGCGCWPFRREYEVLYYGKGRFGLPVRGLRYHGPEGRRVPDEVEKNLSQGAFSSCLSGWLCKRV